MRLVRALAHSAVERHAVNPPRHVGRRNAAAYHALEVHNEVERHLVYIVGVYHDDVTAKRPTIRNIVVHVCKLTKK